MPVGLDGSSLCAQAQEALLPQTDRATRHDGVIELEGYSRPTCNKQCESGHDASTVIGVIHKLDRRRDLLTCCGEIFKVHSYAYFPLLSLVIVRARLLCASYNK